MTLHALAPVRARRARRSGGHGFSTTELLAVVAIIGIMVLVTMPAMINFFAAMKVRTAAHRLTSHMRLCRQVSVSRRTDVILELQANNGATKPQYQAWEERGGNLTRTANGADGTANTEDDENWVIKTEKQMGLDAVKFVDAYNDDTPENPNPTGTSILDTNKKIFLKFSPNGRVVRVDATHLSPGFTTDTLVRMRLEKQITRTRKDVWDATINQSGKVATDFTKAAP